MTTGLVQLPGVFDIGAVTDLAVSIRAAVASDVLVFEASEVSKVDASAIQLLCATVLAAQARGTRVEWRMPTTAVVDGARALGVEGLLGLAEVR